MLAILVIGLAGGLGFGGWRYWGLKGTLEEGKLKLASTTERLAKTEAEAEKREQELLAELASEKEKTGAFLGEVKNLASTVGELDKLSKTDPELLKKYSKYYFLNENYEPENLSAIDSKYLIDEKKDEELLVLTGARKPLVEMLESASSSGHALRVFSAYRSFDTQASLKNNYTVVYGEGANKFSADQGYSEHQLGTTVDLSTAELGQNYGRFDSTGAYKWLNENAYRYGFILSYPADNGFYIFEPWHWRYVGRKLANKLHDDNRNFYNMTQRELDGYLAEFFD